MVIATITNNGQITIPKTVRDSLRLRSGDRVEFLVHGHDEVVLRPIMKSVHEVYGKLHKPNGPRRTLTEMNQAIARRMRNRKR